MSFDPFAPDFDADPHSALHALREQHPVWYWEIGRAWLVSRYDDCALVLRDPRFGFELGQWKHAHEIPKTSLDDYFAHSLLTIDGPDHLRLRKLIGPAFSLRGIASRRPLIEAVVAELLDSIEDDAASFDLVPRFASQVPVRVISDMLGVPRIHGETFQKFAAAVVLAVDPIQRRTLAQDVSDALFAGQDLVISLIEERRRELGADLLSDLIRAEEEGDRLDTEELVMLVKSLLAAGSETTMHLLSFGVLNLLRHPDQLALLRAEPECLENAVDEILRFDFMARLGNARFSLEPLEIQGTKIDAGEMVMPILAAALRDPRRFPDPDRFDLTRDQRHNIAFGHGPHYCVGAGLARLEGQIALSALFERFPSLRLQAEPTFTFHPLMRNVTSIRVGNAT